MRKIEKIQTLDQQTSTLKAENEELASLAKKLKDQVTVLVSQSISQSVSQLMKFNEMEASRPVFKMLPPSGVQTPAGVTVARQQRLSAERESEQGHGPSDRPHSSREQPRQAGPEARLHHHLSSGAGRPTAPMNQSKMGFKLDLFQLSIAFK